METSTVMVRPQYRRRTPTSTLLLNRPGRTSTTRMDTAMMSGRDFADALPTISITIIVSIPLIGRTMEYGSLTPRFVDPLGDRGWSPRSAFLSVFDGLSASGHGHVVWRHVLCGTESTGEVGAGAYRKVSRNYLAAPRHHLFTELGREQLNATGVTAHSVTAAGRPPASTPA